MDQILRDQIAYYRARAPEYDEWFLRQGRFDHGRDFNRRWFSDVEQVRGELHAFAPAGDILELACGTGLWTQRLLSHAASITAVDAAPEALALNQQRLDSERVRYVEADLFAWEPDRAYDAVFFGFWLSHVPPSHFERFWKLVRRALKERGRFFLVDSLYEPTTTASNHVLLGRDSSVQDRKLNDGRAFRIVKVYYEPEDLQTRLQKLGWETQIRRTPHYFLYGSGTPAR